MKKNLLFLVIIFLVSCIAANIKPDSGFHLVLKNNSDRLVYFRFFWVDHNWASGGYNLSIPVAVTEGEIRAGETYTSTAEWPAGKYYIIYENHEKILSERIYYQTTSGENLICEFDDSIISKTKFPYCYNDLLDWKVVEVVGYGVLKEHTNDPHSNKEVTIYLLENPNIKSNWKYIYACINDPSGLVRVVAVDIEEKRAYIFSVINETLVFLSISDYEMPIDRSQGI